MLETIKIKYKEIIKNLKINSPKQRVINEKIALKKKIDSLEKFDTSVIKNEKQKQLLEKQLLLMRDYHDILVSRLSIWEE